MRTLLFNPSLNRGRQIEPIPGIQQSGTQFLVNMNSDRRYHRFLFNVVAVNYTGATGAAITKITSATGAGGTATLTVSAFGIPTAIAIVTGGTGWAVGDTFTVADATGQGFVATVATVSSGAIATATVTTAGTPSAISPTRVIGALQFSVAGSPIIDTTCALEMNRNAMNNAPTPALGQFAVYFTEPWRNAPMGGAANLTSWDMAGQGVFAIKMFLISGFSQVTITGIYEFDFIRNTVAGEVDQLTYQTLVNAGKAPTPLLQIIARHAFTPQLNGGLTIISPQTIPTQWPILRLHFIPGTSGTVNNAIVNADGTIVEQGYIGASSGGAQLDQLREALAEYGFNTTIFEYSYVADKTQRIREALKVSSLKLSIQSTIAEGLTILQERLQTRYE